jgi:hypothetical protein
MIHANTYFHKPLRGLWLARELPFPLDSDDKIYSAGLAKSLAEAGAELTMAGLEPKGGPCIPAGWPIRWHPVSGGRNSTLRSLFNAMPLAAAIHATREYRREVHALARQKWDFVVLDQCGTGWAIERFLARRRSGNGPVLVHVAHGHETSIAGRRYREFPGGLVMRLGLGQDYLKMRALERYLAARVDLVTVPTEEDAALFAADASNARTMVLKPGRSGEISSLLREPSPDGAETFSWRNSGAALLPAILAARDHNRSCRSFVPAYGA